MSGVKSKSAKKEQMIIENEFLEVGEMLRMRRSYGKK
jgi:hypothetical protein